eukprot:12044938-Alexandrium_andersonii.AAC.1
MSASLVGSEMCIRDSPPPREPPEPLQAGPQAAQAAQLPLPPKAGEGAAGEDPPPRLALDVEHRPPQSRSSEG